MRRGVRRHRRVAVHRYAAVEVVRVEEVAELARAPRLIPALDQRGEQKAAANGIDGGRKIEFVGIGIEKEVVFIDIAERLEIRKQRRAAQYMCKGVGEAARRAPRRQIDRRGRKRERMNSNIGRPLSSSRAVAERAGVHAA